MRPPRLKYPFIARLRSNGGAALVEFALVLPILLLLLLGMVDFGKAFNYYIDQTHLANTGARYAAVNVKPSGATLQAYIKGLADSTELRNGGTASVASPGVRVCISFPSGTATPGQPVRVTTTSTYNWIPIVGNNLSAGNVTISSSATMRLEAIPTVYSAGCTS